MTSLISQTGFSADDIANATREVDDTLAQKPLWRRLLLEWAGVLVVLVALAPFVPRLLSWVAESDVYLTPPDFSLLSIVPTAVLVHLAAVTICLPLGGFILWRTKGTPLHRALGRVWVASMIVACASALFIKSFAPIVGPFGLIHLLVIWTLYSLVRGMVAIIWQKNLAAHLGFMQGAYWGLITAGLFSFIPGRLMWSMFTSM
jgi:uncharacterized membrane protein